MATKKSDLLILRQSGKPTKPEAIEAYNTEWPLLYDKIQERVTELTTRETGFLQKVPAHLISERMCDFIERQLFKKHAVDVYVSLPKSSKGWQQLTNEYGSPVLVAEKLDRSGMVLIVMDQLG